MKIISSYAVELRNIRKPLLSTIDIYRSALSFLIDVVEKEWANVHVIKGDMNQMRYIESKVHVTRARIVPYAFDDAFPKMPTYMRRAAINKAIGIVKSYHSNLANWERGDKKDSKPKLQLKHFAMPTFYKERCYLESNEPDTAYLKLYHHNDWVWVKVRLKHTDVRYLQKYWSHVKPSAPTLQREHGKFFLRFAFEEFVDLTDTPISDQRICAVDLGLNTDAVCSIMESDGTILARKFIDFPSDKDQMYRVLNRIKRHQRRHESHDIQGLWGYADHLNIELARHIASAITDFAVLYSVDCIVFEHLDFRGKKCKGGKKQRLSLWRKNTIQNTVEHKAHRCGIHISHICAWDSSKLAFDGSGELTRDEHNHALATFSTGKRYNCDLSASYNIGARYFIRELMKPLPETVRSSLLANVPDARRRPSCTLHTLREIQPYLVMQAA